MGVFYDLILRGGIAVSHQGIGECDIAVKQGKIAAMGQLRRADSAETINCRGLHILPGVIDSQVHFREPGFEFKENMETGSRAAILGGVTTIFEMPNTLPSTTSLETLEDKLRRAKDRMSCDFAFWVGGTRENIPFLSEIERIPGVAGIKVFMGSSTGDLLVEDDESVLGILLNLKRRAAFHAEDEMRLRERMEKRVEGDPSSHTVWRDEQTAFQCTNRLINLARRAKAKIHVLHVSTEEEIQLLETAKDIATAEVTPHHLTMTIDDYKRLGNLMQMNPPIRSQRHQKALWAGVTRGVIDVLGSDHAPHTLEEKRNPYPLSPSGMTGVQTLVPIMLDHVHSGNLSIQRFVELTSYNPHLVFNIASKGCMMEGFDADFTVVDLKEQRTISNNSQASAAGWTPYEGRSVIGWPKGCVIRGQCMMWENQVLLEGQGRPVSFIFK